MLRMYQDAKGVIWCDIEIEAGVNEDHPFRPEEPTRYKLLRMRTKKLAGGRTWVPATDYKKKGHSSLLKLCKLSYASEGLGMLTSQVQTVHDKYAWACPLEENVLGYGCKRFSLSSYCDEGGERNADCKGKAT